MSAATGGLAQDPLALRNLPAAASPAAGAGTAPAAPPDPASPVKALIARVRSAVRSPPPVSGAVVETLRAVGTYGGTAQEASAFRNLPAAASPAAGAGTAPAAPPAPASPVTVLMASVDRKSTRLNSSHL